MFQTKLFQSMLVMYILMNNSNRGKNGECGKKRWRRNIAQTLGLRLYQKLVPNVLLDTKEMILQIRLNSYQYWKYSVCCTQWPNNEIYPILFPVKTNTCAHLFSMWINPPCENTDTCLYRSWAFFFPQIIFITDGFVAE